MKSKEFFDQQMNICQKIIEVTELIDKDEDHADLDIKRVSNMVNAVKQRNNAFKLGLQHDIAKAKFPNYTSSFLDEDE